jgi:hypothetical protein
MLKVSVEDYAKIWSHHKENIAIEKLSRFLSKANKENE